MALGEPAPPPLAQYLLTCRKGVLAPCSDEHGGGNDPWPEAVWPGCGGLELRVCVCPDQAVLTRTRSVLVAIHSPLGAAVAA